MNRTHAHFQTLWDIRQNEKLTRVFASYYQVKTTDLVTSMDGWSYFFALAMTKEMRNRRWFHFDQGRQMMPILPKTKQRYECLQGYVNLADSDQVEDGNLLVLDGAHTLHPLYFQKTKKKKNKCSQGYDEKISNFVPLKPGWIQALGKDPLDYPETIVYSKKGDLVLWYSTLPHQGMVPTPKGRTRCVAYVSQAPRSLLTNKKDIEIRKECWQQQKMTAHWAACYVRASPYSYQSSTGTEKRPVLTPLGHSLL